jgi:hypothetical protein
VGSVLDFNLRDFDAELGFDFRVRLMRSHQAPARERLAHTGDDVGVFASFIFDMQQIESAFGVECKPQGMGEGLRARLEKVSRMSDRLNQFRIQRSRTTSVGQGRRVVNGSDQTPDVIDPRAGEGNETQT